MPTLKKTRTREDELMGAANRLATLKTRRKTKQRELQAIEDEIRIESRAFRALAQQIAGAADDVETPMPTIDTAPEQ